MSWAAHELESYVIQRHFKVRIAFLAVLLGSLAPDLLTKLPVYGINIAGHTYLKAPDAAMWHRGWPGAGFTTSLAFGALLALVVLALTHSREWALGLLIGHWAHVLTDSFDSVGTMLFFPFSTQRYAAGMWAYSAQAGRYADAAAYYSGFGGLWDALWLVIAFSGFEVFRARYFRAEIVPNDPVWNWAQRRWSLSETTLLALYRAWFMYAGCRILGWTVWARFLNPDRGTMTVDLTWGGPHWIARANPPAFSSWPQFLGQTAAAAVALGASLWLLWRFVGKGLWERATEVAAGPVPVVAVVPARRSAPTSPVGAIRATSPVPLMTVSRRSGGTGARSGHGRRTGATRHRP